MRKRCAWHVCAAKASQRDWAVLVFFHLFRGERDLAFSVAVLELRGVISVFLGVLAAEIRAAG
jgi:hypothetical protein